jgi:uncharacterized protein (DUF488 family)
MDRHIPPPTERTLYTIGYESRGQRGLLEKLKASYIEAVCDVRQLPLSRVPGLSKTALSAALGEEDIAYHHYRDLGNPKENRAGYQDPTLRSASREVFTKLLTSHSPRVAALHELAAVVVASRSALLCYEADPECCHRRDVAAAVMDLVPGLTVVNLHW